MHMCRIGRPRLDPKLSTLYRLIQLLVKSMERLVFGSRIRLFMNYNIFNNLDPNPPLLKSNESLAIDFRVCWVRVIERENTGGCRFPHWTYPGTLVTQ